MWEKSETYQENWRKIHTNIKVLSKSMGDSGRNLREIWEKAGKSVQNPRKILAKSAKNTWKIREKSVKNPRKIKLVCACHFRFHSFWLFLAMAGWQSSSFVWWSHGLNFPFHLEIAIDVISLYRSLSGGKCPCRGSWVGKNTWYMPRANLLGLLGTNWRC